MSTTRIDREQTEPTRAQRRARARAERLARELSDAARATRRRRLAQLGGVFTVVLTGIVVVLIATGQGSPAGRLAPESPEARAAAGRVSSLLQGIPQSGNVLGRPGAPVKLQYYADLQCPVCRSFTAGALPSIIRRWVRGGKLEIEYRSLETATREPEVFDEQQIAALAAGRQGRMWNFVETFYQEQQEEDTGYVTEDYLQGIARQVPGLDLARWSADRKDFGFSESLAIDAQTANAATLNGTPAFLIQRAGRRAARLEPTSFTEPKPFDEAIEASLRG
jgi:protein-disulfide isomerase